jgi:hypothetical protein
MSRRTHEHAALCISGQQRSFAHVRRNLSDMVLRVNGAISFDVLMVSPATESDPRDAELCAQPNVRSCLWLRTEDLPSLDPAAAGVAAATARKRVRDANASRGHLRRAYDFAHAMHKQQVCWSELVRHQASSSGTHNYFIGTRFDVELTAPLLLSRLNVRDQFYVRAPPAPMSPNAHTSPLSDVRVGDAATLTRAGGAARAPCRRPTSTPPRPSRRERA